MKPVLLHIPEYYRLHALSGRTYYAKGGWIVFAISRLLRSDPINRLNRGGAFGLIGITYQGTPAGNPEDDSSDS